MPLKRDDFRMNHHRALVPCFGMIFLENRCTLFRIMPQASRRAVRKSPRCIAGWSLSYSDLITDRAQVSS
jgi:hypothetical protein